MVYISMYRGLGFRTKPPEDAPAQHLSQISDFPQNAVEGDHILGLHILGSFRESGK